MQTFSYREATRDFQRHIGAEYDPESVAVAALRGRLILEETAETMAAMCACDIVETADGLADLRYVVMGAAAVYGVDVPDVVLVPDSQPRSPCGADALVFGVSIVTEAARALAMLSLCPQSEKARDTMHIGRALYDLDVATAQFARSLGLPLDALFWEVHRSNMTKTAGGAGASGKYGPGGKGPGYEPPDIRGVLLAAGCDPRDLE